MTETATLVKDAGSGALGQENTWNFAAAWFQALDVHAPEAVCLGFLADDGLRMVFPEQTLTGTGDFLAWYRGGDCVDGTVLPGVVNVFFDENHSLKKVEVEPGGEGVVANILVGWQASWFVPPAAKSRRTSLDAMQRWTLRSCSTDKNPYGVEIVSYNAMAEPFRYAPGFATL